MVRNLLLIKITDSHAFFETAIKIKSLTARFYYFIPNPHCVPMAKGKNMYPMLIFYFKEHA